MPSSIVDKPKAWMAWSSGKDSAWAFHMARSQDDVEIVGLMTTVTNPYDRITMHGLVGSPESVQKVMRKSG